MSFRDIVNWQVPISTVLAFISGVAVEALYALGVIFIGRRRAIGASLLSMVWGGAFLIGVNESFLSHKDAVAWCIGLGVGTFIGVRIGGDRP